LGDVFTHPQEHLTVLTVSDSIHPSCCRLVFWVSWNWAMWLVGRIYVVFCSSCTQRHGNLLSLVYTM